MLIKMLVKNDDIMCWALSFYLYDRKMGPFSIYEQPKYKPNLTLSLTLILTQILTLKPTWVDATIRSHFGCSYIEKEPKNEYLKMQDRSLN